MRYVLIDRIASLEPGRSLTAVKNVTASDGMMTWYGPDRWALPAAMVLEAMAQAAGVLALSAIGNQAQPVLAKVQPFEAHGYAVAGDQILVRAELDELNERGCRSHATASIGSTPLAEATIFLAFVPADAGRQGEPLRTTLARAFPGWLRAHTDAEVSS